MALELLTLDLGHLVCRQIPYTPFTILKKEIDEGNGLVRVEGVCRSFTLYEGWGAEYAYGVRIWKAYGVNYYTIGSKSKIYNTC
jgi:hypothetical protein